MPNLCHKPKEADTPTRILTNRLSSDLSSLHVFRGKKDKFQTMHKHFLKKKA
uniref:Uncharacterized protein n=1 Tax=Setaria italica TaxID=4555 RepID=K3XU80_SETIT